MAAMRGATHQKLQSFDFNNVSQYGGQQFIYPNQTNLNGGRNDAYFGGDAALSNFMTPSPDSPGQWSSGSPQSQADWSDGIMSPPATVITHFQQHQHQHLSQQQLLQQQQAESILI